MFDDPEIGISWPALHGDDVFDIAKLTLSEKDKKHPSFAEFKKNLVL